MTTTLENGIDLPAIWPPRDVDLADPQPHRIPWLEQPPTVIPIDRGRQLLVDDFLVDSGGTSMVRVFHQPVKYPANPILFPVTAEERAAPHPPCAVAKCGGVWYDFHESAFRMWYMASYVGSMAHARSTDGIHWERPEADVVPGTNLCLPQDIHPDSGSVIIDHHCADPAGRYKMLQRERNPAVPGRFPDASVLANGTFPAGLYQSADGIHWRQVGITGPMDDRSTMYYDPFRKRWVQSIRAYHGGGAENYVAGLRAAQGGARRCRLFFEDEDFVRSGNWQAGEPTMWCRADSHDTGRDGYPELYNLDAIAYESLLVGFHQILKGPPNGIGMQTGRPKLTELTVGYSRDGFHWHRPDRRSFIGARRELGSWEYGYVESSAGMVHIVGDELWIYYSAYGGARELADGINLHNGTYANGAVGLAKLRRDGFASMQARFAGADMTTRPLRFSGAHLFVNASTVGSPLRVAALDPDTGEALPGFAAEDCLPFIGNSTAAAIRWREHSLGALANRPVRLRFTMDRGDIYSFWVAQDQRGHSNGYTAAGGPGLPGPVDR